MVVIWEDNNPSNVTDVKRQWDHKRPMQRLALLPIQHESETDQDKPQIPIEEQTDQTDESKNKIIRKINSLLLTAEQLKFKLDQIKLHIYKTLELQVPKEDLLELYKVMKIK